MVIDRRTSENSKSVALFASGLCDCRCTRGSNIKIAAHLRVTRFSVSLAPPSAIPLKWQFRTRHSRSVIREDFYDKVREIMRLAIAALLERNARKNVAVSG